MPTKKAATKTSKATKTTKVVAKKPLTLDRVYPYILVVGGLIGLLMAFIITLEKIHLIQDPSYVPECSINPIISCGNIMKSEQASAFGFPNPLIGLMGYAVVTTVGMALLAGAKFKRWFWLGLQAGTALGVIFCMWLAYQAIYSIHSLCPYCIVAWIVTIAMFLYTFIMNVRSGFIKVEGRAKTVTDFIQRHHGDILIGWYLVITFLIGNHFWYYWKTLL